MKLYDKQTGWGIAVIVLALALIIGGSIAGYDAVNNVQESTEDRKNEATLQINESKGDNTDSAAHINSGMLQYAVAEQQPWPDVGTAHHCLLVNVPPPLSYPEELSSNNTVRLPAELCSSIINSIKRLIELDMLDPSDLRFP